MGTFPKHGSSWRWGHPQLCMAWGGQLNPAVCMATAGSTQRCLAWLEWHCMNLAGGRAVWHSPRLVELTVWF